MVPDVEHDICGNSSVKACVDCVIVLPASVAGNVNVFERANNENCEKD